VADTDVFSLDKSDLNGFLFADIGLESSGMPLSVISLLARLGLDPWLEAGRLARLPPGLAADGLARSIAAMPASLWPMSDATPIAARLVALLPGRGEGPAIAEKAFSLDWRWLLLAVMTLFLMAQVAVRFATPTPAAPPISAPTTPARPPTSA
jgi:hypothetical protein